MHRRVPRVLRRVFVPIFVLLLAVFVHALLRTNFLAARVPSVGRGKPRGGQVVVRRIDPPETPFGRVVVLDGATYPWTDAGFSAALAAAGSHATVVLPPQALVTLTSAHTIADDDLTVRCEPGAAFVSGIDEVSLITIIGSSDEIFGCEFTGGSHPHSNPLFLWNSRNARIQGNAATGFFGAIAAFVYLVGADSSIIQGNQCTAAPGGTGCIFGEKDALNTLVKDNDINESLGGPDDHDITFHSTTPGTSVSGTQILNNHMLAGEGFCVEIGAFGGESVDGFVISGNTCEMSANGLGGYSVGSTAAFWSVVDNIFDAHGYIPQIACLEVAGATDGILLGNSCNGGHISLSNVEAQRVTISSNVIYNFHAAAGIYVGTAVTSGEMSDNLITSNLIHLPPGTATAGIWQQCLARGATCSHNSYYYNVVVSDGTPGSVGIKFENDNGTSSDETLGPNTFHTPAESIEYRGTITFVSDSAPAHAPAPPAPPPHLGSEASPGRQ